MNRRIFVAYVLTILVAGCGQAPPPPLAEAEGTVLLDGRPLGHVEVRLIPKMVYGAHYIAKGNNR